MSDERNSFHKTGILGPVAMLTAAECATVMRHAATLPRTTPHDWTKALAVGDRLFFDIATRPRLLALLVALLGDDVVLWGASLVRRQAGEAHSWHTDMESSAADGRFVSAWIGLQNTSTLSSLQFVAGSHAFGCSLQQDLQAHGLRRGEASDDDVLALAHRHDPTAELVQLAADDGDAILFDGKLWHGSRNRRDEGARVALLLQYAAASQPVFRPDPSCGEWPFRFLAAPRPPVVVVKGRADPDVNWLVAPPELSQGPPARGDADVLTVVRPLALPLAEDPVGGWRPYPIFGGATPVVDRMICHVSVLSAGRSPHPPHAHLDEEILIVLDGTAQLVIAEREDDPAPRVEAVTPGDFAYYPAYQHHTIRNHGTAPVTYLMFRWRAAPAETRAPLSASIFRCGSLGTALPESGRATTPVFEKPTFFLDKLHAHWTAIGPGVGYEAHRDEHDAAFVVLAGSIETFGQEEGAAGTGNPAGHRLVGPHGVVYFAAGQPHGLRNPGSAPARYLVLELHASAAGRARGTGPAYDGVTSLAHLGSANLTARSRRWLCRRQSEPPPEPDRVDAAWYLRRYPDVAAAGVDPVAHYERFGAREGRLAGPLADGGGLFDGAAYLRQNPDVAAAGVNPLDHYLDHGANEGRRARALFDGDWYLSQSPDARGSGLNPLVHFFRHGRHAGKSPSPGAMPDGSPPPFHESIDWQSPADVRGQITAYLAAYRSAPRRIVICTAIFGGWDHLMLPDRIDPEIDYVCFSDEAWNGHGVWQIRPAPYRHRDPVRMARYVKTHLSTLFPSHDVAIWVDGNIVIRGDVKTYVDVVRQQGAAIGVIKHPVRRCVYEEARICKWEGRDAPDIIDRQMERYRLAGVPRNDGLLETNFLVLRLHEPGIGPFLQTWWQEIDAHSRRDQLSVGWALRQTGLRIAPLLPPSRSLRDHDDFSYFSHER